MGETGQERCAGLTGGQGGEREGAKVEGEIDQERGVGGQGGERERVKVDGAVEIEEERWAGIEREGARVVGGQGVGRGGEGKEDFAGGEGEGGKSRGVEEQKWGGDSSRHPSLSRHTKARRLTCFGPLFKRFSTQAPLHGLSPARLETDPLWDFLPKDSGLSAQDLERAERRRSRSLSQPDKRTKGKGHPKEGGGSRQGEVERDEENSRKGREEVGGDGGQVVETKGNSWGAEAGHFEIGVVGGGAQGAGGGDSRREGPRGKAGGQTGVGGGEEEEMEGVGGTQDGGGEGGEKAGGGAGGVRGGRAGGEGESGEEYGSRERRGGVGGRLLSCGNYAMAVDSLYGDSSRYRSPPSDRGAIRPPPLESCLPVAPWPRGTQMDLEPSSSHDISLHSERIGTPTHAVERYHPILLPKQQRRRAVGTGGRGGRGGRRRGRGGDVVTNEGDKNRFADVHEGEDSSQRECATKEEPTSTTKVDSENEDMVESEGASQGMSSDEGGGRHSALRRRFNTQRGRRRLSGSSSCSRTSPSEIELEAFPRGGKTPLAQPNRKRSSEKIQHETNREEDDAAYPSQILPTLEHSIQGQGRGPCKKPRLQ